MATSLITADTSVVVPALSEWHDAHIQAVTATEDVVRLPAHVLLEVVATLTRLPHGLSVGIDVATRALGARFPEPPFILDEGRHAALLARLGASRLRGGQVYDALIAATAREAGAVLLTRDGRAESTYRFMGVEMRFVS